MAERLDLEAELDGVYTAPLKEFVKARDELAAKLKAAGDRQAADRVKALKKPNVAAWAVNQLPGAAPRVWSALVEAADRLRSVKASELRDALQARRDAVNAARRKAEELLGKAGHAAETATMMKVAGTLEALGTYGSQPGHPVAGRLTEELPPPSFDEIAALSLPQAKPALEAVPPLKEPAKPVAPEPERPAATRVDEVALARARKEVGRARADLEERRQKAEEGKRRLKGAQERATQAGREHEELTRKLALAEQEERRSGEALEHARDAAEEAAAAVVHAEKALAEAEEQLAALQRPPAPTKKKR